MASSIQKMSSAPARSLSYPVLVGDLGGTNARFQIVRESNDPIRFETVPTKDFSTLEDAVEGAVLAKTDVVPRTALLAAAGPIKESGLNLTNNHWDIRPDHFFGTMPMDDLVLMNDFEAQALALPYLEQDDLARIGGSGNETAQLRERTKAVLGPGTGLGVCLLVRANGYWVPVAGEGGHVDMGPRNPREAEIWPHLETIGGRISGEQMLCGDGLVNLYKACAAASGVEATLGSDADISRTAMSTDNPADPAREALALFCTLLGRIAGDLALTSTARGGVYIGGGIVRHILPFIQQSDFRNAFEDKAPHGDLMKAMATVAVTHDLPALVGLVGFARNPEQFLVDMDHRLWRRS